MYIRSYTKLRTTHGLRTYNYTGIATCNSYSLSASSAQYAHRLWLRCVYFYQQLNTYTVQMQTVSVYALVHIVYCSVTVIVVLRNTHGSVAHYACSTQRT